MLMPASSEFISLCQSQVALLAEGLGAALSVVYLTEELVEDGEAKLIPVVVYPETAAIWEEASTLGFLPEQSDRTESPPRLLSGTLSEKSQISPSILKEPESDSPQEQWSENALWRQRQIVLPLIHEGVVMGLLVTAREDRPWDEQERNQIEEIAHTLALALLLDQRRAWFEQRLHQQQRLQAQQHDFLSDLLHQFRNPLTALRTFGKLLMKRLQPGDTNRDVAAGIVRESDRLQELLQEFDSQLDLTETPDRILPPVTSLEPTPYSLLPTPLESCSIGDVLESLLVSARAIAQERSLNLISDIPSNLPLIQGNAKALREVFSNLIDNALKYTPAGGLIQVQVSVWESSVVVNVSDTGAGIPAQDLEHIFERHYRGVQAQTNIPGTGLGLAIAKELIEKMQGQIKVISPAKFNWTSESSTNILPLKNLGAGTTVRVSLPI